MRYRRELLELEKGKKASDLNNEAEATEPVLKLKESVEVDELDGLIQQQAQFGRAGSRKNK
jgi:hypothetical protein